MPMRRLSNANRVCRGMQECGGSGSSVITACSTAEKHRNTIPRWSAAGAVRNGGCRQPWRKRVAYFLFSTSRKSRISEVFVTEQEIWGHVRAQGLWSEVIDREDLDPRRILHPDYEIHFCDAQGRRIGGTAVREWPVAG